MAEKGIRVHIYGDYNDKDLRRAMRDLKTLQTNSLGVGERLQQVGSQVQTFGKSVSRIGGTLTKTVTLPIVGVGAAATKMAMDFDDSLTKMVSLVGLTRDEVDGMRGDIIAMASQYGKSATEAADAMFFITSAGLRGADAMETLEASLKGSVIGLGDVSTIADLATSAMNAYGSETLSATEATSILRTAVAEGKLEADQLAGSMGSVLPVASALGVGFDEAAAAMAAMSRTGTNASEASTQLRGIFTQLIKETPKGAKALNSVGLSYEGLREQIREKGLLSTLQTLVGAFGDNTVAAGNFFGNTRALTGVMDMLGEGAATTEEIFDSLAATTAEDLNPAFDEAASTTGFELRQAFATLKNSLIEFGDIIAPFVAQFAQRIKSLGEAFQGLSPQAKSMIVTAGAIAAAVGPVLLILGKLITMVGGVIKVVGLLIAAFNPVTLVVGAVVAAIALLVGAFVLAWRHSEPLRKAVQELFGVLRNLGRVIVDTVLGALRTLIGEGNKVGDIFQTIGRVAGNILTPIIRTLTGIVKGVGAAFQVAGKIFEVQVAILRMIGNIIVRVVVAAIDIWMNRLGPLSTFLRNMANGIRSAFSVVASAVVSLFNNAGKILEGFVNRAIGVVNAIIDAYNVLARALGGMQQVARITEFRLTSLSAATDGAATANSALAGSVRDSHQSYVAFGMDAAGKVSNGLNGLGDAAADLAFDMDGLTDSLAGSSGSGNGGAAKASDKAAERLAKFKETFNEVAASLKAKSKEIEESYNRVVKSVQDVVTGAFDVSDIDPERIGENGEKVGGTWLDGLASQAEKAVNFANKVAQVIKLGLEPGSAAFDMVMQVTKQQGEGLLNELIEGGVERVNRAREIVESVTEAGKRVGIEAADQFYGTGLKLAKDTEAAFTKRFGEGGPGFGKLNRLMSALANSMRRTTYVDVVTRYRNEGSPGTGTLAVGATGGIVNRPTFALIGEAGPEAVVPLSRTPGNEPLTITRNGSTKKDAGTTINLTVNAGIGTDGAEVGRVILDSIKAYERRNGAVYVSA